MADQKIYLMVKKIGSTSTHCYNAGAAAYMAIISRNMAGILREMPAMQLIRKAKTVK